MHHTSSKIVPNMSSVPDVNTGNIGTKKQETKNIPCIIRSILRHLLFLSTALIFKPVKNVDKAINA